MINVSSAPPKNVEKHECESHMHGNWIIYKCPICHDYERRYNWKTGEMSVSGNNDHIAHFGRHIPDETINGFKYVH